MHYSKKISSKKGKIWEIWCYRELNVKYHGYHTFLIRRKYKAMKFYINGLTKQAKFQEHSRIKDSVEKYA